MYDELSKYLKSVFSYTLDNVAPFRRKNNLREKMFLLVYQSHIAS